MSNASYPISAPRSSGRTNHFAAESAPARLPGAKTAACPALAALAPWGDVGEYWRWPGSSTVNAPLILFEGGREISFRFALQGDWNLALRRMGARPTTRSASCVRGFRYLLEVTAANAETIAAWAQPRGFLVERAAALLLRAAAGLEEGPEGDSGGSSSGSTMAPGMEPHTPKAPADESEGSRIAPRSYTVPLTGRLFRAAQVMQATEQVRCEVLAAGGELVLCDLLARGLSDNGFAHVQRHSDGKTTLRRAPIAFRRIYLDTVTAARLETIAADQEAAKLARARITFHR